MSNMDNTPHEELASLSADLREVLEWERASGATYLEAEPRIVEQIAPVAPRPAAPKPVESSIRSAPRPASSRPMSRPNMRPIRQEPQKPASSGAPGEGLAAIRQELGHCQRCGLHQGRQNIVFGVGPDKADVVVIGEAPGRNEDITGEPFVGRAGKLLNRMLESIGSNGKRFTSVTSLSVDHRRIRPGRRKLLHVALLHRQLKALEPKVILTVGRFAGQNIVGSEASMGELRKEIRSMNGIPVVPTYHPAYLLRNPRMKRAAWEDLCKVQELLDT